ncbi:YitT family protein [Pandoraea commovens]|uniref:Membrane protein n=1 Tax=Pandoraea commovens TaxID=2508289 RepID=A0A5E4WW89_9BURK|nr:YitT family protein [Pandoraea commovens]UVA80140.1 YitT family protein [Pandoraea commovens]VVE29107.1 membrane protein [Pandoraea commovens]
MKHDTGAVSGAIAATDTIGVPHSVLEDIYAMVIGMAFVVVGLVLLKAAGLVTGGVAGIALLASYVFPLPVGTIFTLVNIPFFLFAYFTMGARFALKSTVASFGITFALAAMPQTFDIAFVNPLFAAFVGGTLCGMGILALARHGAGVGGTGIVTLWLQRKRGINAGITQVCIDTTILIASLATIPAGRVAWSAISAIAMSAMVVAWHKPGRYTGR